MILCGLLGKQMGFSFSLQSSMTWIQCILNPFSWSGLTCLWTCAIPTTLTGLKNGSWTPPIIILHPTALSEFWCWNNKSKTFSSLSYWSRQHDAMYFCKTTMCQSKFFDLSYCLETAPPGQLRWEFFGDTSKNQVYIDAMYFCKSLEQNVGCVVSCWCWCIVFL